MAKTDEKKAVKTEKSVAAEKKVDDGKLKALGLAMDQITKQFGDGSIMKLGEAHKVDVEVIPVDSSKFPAKAKRPLNSTMSLAKAKATGFVIPTWQDALKEFYKQEVRK